MFIVTLSKSKVYVNILVYANFLHHKNLLLMQIIFLSIYFGYLL